MMTLAPTQRLIVWRSFTSHLANTSDRTYILMVRAVGKPLVWLHGEVKTPPFSAAGRIEAGRLLRDLQNGALLVFPDSRPLPVIGARCHELRIGDATGAWRIVYRLDPDAVISFGRRTRRPRWWSYKRAGNACDAMTCGD